MNSRRQEEFEKGTRHFHQGLVQGVRLIVFGAIAFYLANQVFAAEWLTFNQVYRLGLPRDVPEIAITLAVALIILFAFELVFFLVYVWIRPSGRRRASTAHVSAADLNRYDGN